MEKGIALLKERYESVSSRLRCTVDINSYQGTWYFIAARLIAWGINPIPVQNRIDDIESFFHVLMYMASHYTDHGFSGNDVLGEFVESYFRRAAIHEGRSCGGQGKMTFFRAGGAGIIENIKNVRLLGLIMELMGPLAARYAIQRFKHGDDKHGHYVRIPLDFPQEHYDNLNLLEDPGWFVKTLTTYINKPDWEENGSLIAQTIPAGVAMQASKTRTLPTSALDHQDPLLVNLEKEKQKRKADEAELPQEVVPTPDARGEPSKKRRKVPVKKQPKRR